jgi:Brp/Blh family beta-carotene 15,15'-monooxygenase
MIALRQNILFGVLTIVFIGFYLIAGPFPEQWNIALLIFFLVSTGIPHGAIDHIIFKTGTKSEKYKKISLLKGFFFPYVLLMMVMFLMWLLVPVFTFWFFLLIAAYHFGQSQLYYLNMQEYPVLKFLLYSIWGVFILSWLWIIHWESQIENLESVFEWDLSRQGSLYRLIQFIAVSSPVLLLGSFMFTLRKRIIDAKTLIIEAGILMLLITMFLLLPMYVAFGFYFGLWHSMRVIWTEYHYIKKNNRQPLSVLKFSSWFLPFSLLSFIGLFLLLFSSYWLQTYITPFMLFLIFISGLTLPHAFFMEKMYGWLEEKNLKMSPD